MLVHNFRPLGAGTELQAERLACKLAERGIHVQIVTPHQHPDHPKKEQCGLVQITRVPFYLTHGVNRRALPLFWWLLRHRNEFDIIHSHMAYGHSVAALVAATILRKKSIVKLAGAGQSGDLYNFSQQKMGKIALKAMAHTDAFIAVSQQIEDEIQKHGLPMDRVLRIPNGVDTDEFKRSNGSPSSGKIRFVLLGQLYPVKGIDIVLHAVKHLIEAGYQDKFEVHFHGRTNPDYDYPAMAKELGLLEHIVFHPFSADVRTIYDNAHAYLLASRSEGLSNALLESMAMECAVVGTRVSGTQTVFGNSDCGILVEPENPSQLAGGMQQIIDSPELAQELGRAARKRVMEAFSLNSVATSYQKLYTLLLGANA